MSESTFDEAWEIYHDLMGRREAGEDLGPKYSGTSGAVLMKWPDIFLDFIMLAHRWRQNDPFGTFLAAHRVIKDNADGFRDPEEFQRFLDCFADPRKNEKRSRVIPLKNRRRVLAAGECAVCGSTDDLAVDHKRPFSRGGSHHIGNLQCLCRSCNSVKGARTMEEWLDV